MIQIENRENTPSKGFRQRYQEKKYEKQRTNQYTHAIDGIKSELDHISKQLGHLEGNFNESDQEDMIEVVIWEQNSLEMKYRSLLKKAKQLAFEREVWSSAAEEE